MRGPELYYPLRPHSLDAGAPAPTTFDGADIMPRDIGIEPTFEPREHVVGVSAVSARLARDVHRVEGVHPMRRVEQRIVVCLPRSRVPARMRRLHQL